jgi:hypothetical protein
MTLIGFAYNQSVGLSATDQTVYQQDVVIHRTDGIPYGTLVNGLYEVHFFVGTHCKEDFGDIRFTDGSGNELAYYLWPDYTSRRAPGSPCGWRGRSAGTLVIWYGNPSGDDHERRGRDLPLFRRVPLRSIGSGEMDRRRGRIDHGHPNGRRDE